MNGETDMNDYEGAELCQCGHRLDDHISIEIGTDDVDLCCGRCGCDDFRTERRT